MKRYLLPLVMLVSLTGFGCETTQTPAKVLITTCDAYGQALSGLADFKAKMSPAQVARVTEVRNYVHPFCAKDQPLPVDPNTAVQYIIKPVTELTTLLTTVKAN